MTTPSDLPQIRSRWQSASRGLQWVLGIALIVGAVCQLLMWAWGIEPGEMR